MASKAEVEKKPKEGKPLPLDNFPVSKIGFWGSFVNDQQTVESDVELLVEFTQPVGWDFFTPEKYLEQALGDPLT